MGVSKTSVHIQIKIEMQKPSQEPPVSSKAPNEDLKDMDALCTFKIRIDSQNSDHRCIKDQWPYPKLPKPSQESPASSIAPYEDLKGMDVLYTFEIKIES